MKPSEQPYKEQYDYWIGKQDSESLLGILDLSDEDLAEHNHYAINVTKDELAYTYDDELDTYFEYYGSINSLWI